MVNNNGRIWVPKQIAWGFLKSTYNSPIRVSFIPTVNKDYVQASNVGNYWEDNKPMCLLWTNVQTRPPVPRLVRATQIWGTMPGEDWWIDFIVIPKAPGGSKHLLVFIDSFTGWIKAFSYRTESTNKVTKGLNIKLRLHSAWRPQSSGKTEYPNRTPKKTQNVARRHRKIG